MSHLISPDQLDERVVFVEPTVLQTLPQNAVICAHALRSVPPGTFRGTGQLSGAAICLDPRLILLGLPATAVEGNRSSETAASCRVLVSPEPCADARTVDAMDALDASAKRVVELVGQVGPDQWSNATPCTEWNVRVLVGHLIASMQGMCELLKGAPVAMYISMLERQGQAAGTDPVVTCDDAVRSVRAAFAEPGVLERTVHHAVDIPGSQLLVFRINDNVIHSWDLATAIGADLGLDERVVEFVYGHLAPRAQSGVLYATGWISAPSRPLPEGATSLERLIHLVGR
jgi:uncharacterized protein (TIGR03086 family)